MLILGAILTTFDTRKEDKDPIYRHIQFKEYILLILSLSFLDNVPTESSVFQ